MPDVTKLRTLKLTFREASHIDYVHEKRHMFVSLETRPTPLSIVIHRYNYSTHKVIFKEHFVLFERSSRKLNSNYFWESYPSRTRSVGSRSTVV